MTLSTEAVLDALAASPLPTAYIDRERVFRFVSRALAGRAGVAIHDMSDADHAAARG